MLTITENNQSYYVPALEELALSKVVNNMMDVNLGNGLSRGMYRVTRSIGNPLTVYPSGLPSGAIISPGMDVFIIEPLGEAPTYETLINNYL